MFKEYIFLAAGCVSVGIIATFVVLGVSARLGIDIGKHLWIVALPAAFSLFLNVTVLEIYRRWRRRRG